MDVFGLDSEAFLDFGGSKISCDFQGQGFDLALGTQSSNHWCSHLFLLRLVLLANPQGKQQTVHREGHPLLKAYGEWSTVGPEREVKSSLITALQT